MAKKDETKKVETKLADNQMIVKCRTRINETSTEKVLTELTVTFDDDKAVREFAKRGIVIAWQALARMAGTIPTSDVVSVAELIKRSGGGGFKVTPDSVAAKINKMPPAEYSETLLKMGIDAATAKKMTAAYSAKYVAPTAKPAKPAK